MQSPFEFRLDESWQNNLERLKVHMEAVDAQCAKILFDSISILQTDDNNARREFNQKILEALEIAAQADINTKKGA